MCCGSKRLTEIACPPECGYLSSARQHPAAVVQRQQAHDVATLMPTLRHLTERQHQLFFLFQTVIARHTPEGFVRFVDADVAEAAGAMAATLETSARGVIYDQEPQSREARALIGELKALIAQAREQGASVSDLEGAAVLRAIEQGAQGPSTSSGQVEAGDSAYLQLMARLLQFTRPAGVQGPATAAAQSSLILP